MHGSWREELSEAHMVVRVEGTALHVAKRRDIPTPGETTSSYLFFDAIPRRIFYSDNHSPPLKRQRLATSRRKHTEGSLLTERRLH